MPNEETVDSAVNTQNSAVNTQNSANIGTVYILSNKAMPDLIKIGRTKKTVTERVNDLYGTGVPERFDVLYACTVNDPEKVEKALHNVLADYRTNPRREFFKVVSERVTPLLALLGIKDETEDIQQELDLEFIKTTPATPTTQTSCITVQDAKDVPDEYKTYQDLTPPEVKEKYPLVFTDDLIPGLLGYRISVHHRVKNVPYYKVTKGSTNTAYYHPKTFEEELQMEQKAKEQRQATLIDINEDKTAGGI
jgi:hypothetical protein